MSKNVISPFILISFYSKPYFRPFRLSSQIPRRRLLPHLRFGPLRNNFISCRFTNFIATGATMTAKSSSAPATGRGQNARIAVPRKSPRNFPASLPLGLAKNHPARTAAAGTVAAARATAIKSAIRDLRFARQAELSRTRQSSLADFPRADARQIGHRPVGVVFF